MNQKPLFLAVTFLALLVIGGAFWTMQKRQIATNQSVTTEPAVETSVQAEPKNIIRVSDGAVSFSFEVPSSWTVETRNMGEKKMTATEMMEFFKTNRDVAEGSLDSDYTNQYSLKQIETLDFKHLEKIFKDAERDKLKYPNASVSSNGWIYYGDGNKYQTDFYILSELEAKEYMTTIPTGKISKVEGSIIDGERASIFIFKSNGDPGTGSRKIFIYGLGKIGDRALYINKQYYPENEAQEDFDHLIETLKFE
ncbi:MAG: hypothetical protein ACEQSB_01360 [Undibacterium sp.]